WLRITGSATPESEGIRANEVQLIPRILEANRAPSDPAPTYFPACGSLGDEALTRDLGFHLPGGEVSADRLDGLHPGPLALDRLRTVPNSRLRHGVEAVRAERRPGHLQVLASRPAPIIRPEHHAQS